MNDASPGVTTYTEMPPTVITTGGASYSDSMTLSILAGIGIALIIIFFLVILVYFWAFNTPAMHEIIVKNTTNVPINVIFGGINNQSNVVFLPVRQIAVGASFTYKASPNVDILVQGYRNGDAIITTGFNPFTTVGLQLAGNNFAGKNQITDGSAMLTNLAINRSSVDNYGVSVQSGYNLPITISSTAFNNQVNNNAFSCGGPIWNHSITATGTNACPDALQEPSVTNYQVCESACLTFNTNDFCCLNPGACNMKGGCEAGWPNQNYYNVFASACPNCLITNCDNPNYTCGSKGGLTQYTIVFLPF